MVGDGVDMRRAARPIMETGKASNVLVRMYIASEETAVTTGDLVEADKRAGLNRS